MTGRFVAILHVALGLAAMAGLGGCATAPLSVRAMRFDVEPPRQRPFQIGTPEIVGAEGAIAAPQLAGYVSTALRNRGFQPAPTGAPAPMVIDVTFEQEPRRVETRTGTEKLYQWQPERIILATKQTKTSTGLVITERVPKRVAAHSEAVGSRTIKYLVEVFPKRLQIVGRTPVDPASGEIGRPLWAVEVRDDREVHDLEQCAVQMIAAAMDHLGDDFSGQKIVYVSPGDERARLIRRGQVRANRAARNSEASQGTS